MAVRVNIISAVVGLEAPVGDVGINSNAAVIRKHSRGASTIRDPVYVTHVMGGYSTTFNLDAIRPMNTRTAPRSGAIRLAKGAAARKILLICVMSEERETP